VIRWLALALGLVCGGAWACPPPSDTLLFHSCWGDARAELILLPDEPLPAVPAGARRHLVVTGAYTGKDARPGGAPKPVGLFVDGGQVINPNRARMDGVLFLPAEGPPSLHHGERVRVAGKTWTLSDAAQRLAFARTAAQAGASVLQSHLLIIEGAADVRPTLTAPRYRRRIWFTDAHGWGVWQSAEPLTLYTATARLRTALSPRMALNLDMGSFDYCRLTLAGTPTRCGLRSGAETAGLSNLLVLTLH